MSHTSSWKETSQLWRNQFIWLIFFFCIVKPLSERIKSLQESSKKIILATALSFKPLIIWKHFLFVLHNTSTCRQHTPRIRQLRKRKIILKGHSSHHLGIKSGITYQAIKMDMIFGTWYGKSLFRSGPLNTAARKRTNYGSDLVQVQMVTWQDSNATTQYFIFNEQGNESHQLWTGLFCTRKNHISSHWNYNQIHIFCDVMLCHWVHQGLSHILPTSTHLSPANHHPLTTIITLLCCQAFFHICHSSQTAYLKHHNPSKCQEPLNQQHGITT
jgi:hypothetical protein